MVEPRILDDYKPGDWIGVHYSEPEKGFYCFPTIVKGITNRNENPLEDKIEIEIYPPDCTNILKREFISRIWHIGEIYP